MGKYFVTPSKDKQGRYTCLRQNNADGDFEAHCFAVCNGE